MCGATVPLSDPLSIILRLANYAVQRHRCCRRFNAFLGSNFMRAFDTRDELIGYLRSVEVAAQIRQWLSHQSWTWKQVVVKSIDGTTFRAFHTKRFGRGPATLYREWGHEYFPKNISAFASSDSAASYQDAIDAAVSSLQSAWPVERPLDYGRAAKMINLTLKHCLLLADLPLATRQALGLKLHVALDRYTLAPVARLGPQFKLPAVPTMQSVQDRAHYLDIQEWIRCLCSEAGVDPMVFEFALFNVQRGSASFPSSLATESPASPKERPRKLRSAASPKERPRKLRSEQSKGASPIKPALLASTVWLAPDGSPAGASLPYADPSAKITRLRRVEQVPVLKVAKASYRNAVFSGVVELADPAAPWQPERNGKANRARVRIRWFDHTAARGYVNLTLNTFEFVDGYTGEVVDNLGK
jgi:hypothetical protein